MAQVFLSYATEDWERVKVLAEALGQAGFTVFWDRTILPGENWRQVLSRELETAGCVVVAWTEASVESHWVLEEAEKASARLVPVRLDLVELPFGFGQWQAADLTDWDGDTSYPPFAAVCRSINTRLGLHQPVTPPPPPWPYWKLVLWGGALASAIAGGVGVWVLLRDRFIEQTKVGTTEGPPATPDAAAEPYDLERTGSLGPRRQVYAENFSDAGAVSAELWALGAVGDWRGEVDKGVYQLCNAAESERASYTATFRYLEAGNVPVTQVGGSIMLTVGLGDGLDNHSMAGILFRASPDKSSYYALARSTGKRVSVLEKRGDKVKVLSTYPSPAGDAEPVKLRVDTGAAQYQLFVNDELVHSIPGPATNDERSGVFALGKGCFSFDNADLSLSST